MGKHKPNFSVINFTNYMGLQSVSLHQTSFVTDECKQTELHW